MDAVVDKPAANGRSAGKFLCACFAVLLLGLLLVAALNFTIDPGSIFQIWKNRSGALERQLAVALNSGSNVATGLYFDVPEMKIDTVTSRAAGPDVIVLGSSRGMEVRSAALGGSGAFFNAYVPSANLQDVLAMYDACTAGRPAKPSLVLWCIDPWVLNAGHPDISWDTLAERYRAVGRTMKIDLPAIPSSEGAPLWRRAGQQIAQGFEKASQLIAWGYTSESLKVLGQRWESGQALLQPDFTLTHQDFEKLRVFRADGSVGFEATYRDFSPQTVEQIALAYGRPPAFGLGDFSGIDPERRKILEQFVSDLQAKGTTVAFYLPPYHPSAYSEFLQDPSSRMVVEVEKYLRNYAAAHGIVVCGSYDPSRAGCVAGDFFDAAHLHGSRVSEILRPLRERLAKP